MVDKRKQRVNNSKRLSYAEKESTIERQILCWFIRRCIMAWKVKTTATYDAKIGRYRRTPPWYRKGVWDIHGFYQGVPFIMEVKSKNGRLSAEQVQFKNDWLKCAAGGFAFVVHSLEDANEAMQYIEDARGGTAPLISELV